MCKKILILISLLISTTIANAGHGARFVSGRVMSFSPQFVELLDSGLKMSLKIVDLDIEQNHQFIIGKFVTLKLKDQDKSGSLKKQK